MSALPLPSMLVARISHPPVPTVPLSACVTLILISPMVSFQPVDFSPLSLIFEKVPFPFLPISPDSCWFGKGMSSICLRPSLIPFPRASSLPFHFGSTRITDSRALRKMLLGPKENFPLYYSGHHLFPRAFSAIGADFWVVPKVTSALSFLLDPYIFCQSPFFMPRF